MFHIRVEEANGRHTRLTVFANGANCGVLTFANAEALEFIDRFDWGRVSVRPAAEKGFQGVRDDAN